MSGLTAWPVGDGDGLREALAAVIFDRHPMSGWGAKNLADALLPVVTAWAEQRARARASGELTALAFRLLDRDVPEVVFEEIVAAREAALAADNRTGQR